jgi:hypothetical protein
VLPVIEESVGFRSRALSLLRSVVYVARILLPATLCREARGIFAVLLMRALGRWSPVRGTKQTEGQVWPSFSCVWPPSANVEYNQVARGHGAARGSDRAPGTCYAN